MSDKTNKVDSHLLEHRFWLQIMGDHARFIFYSLAANESEFIQRSQDFIINYDLLSDKSRKDLTEDEIETLNRQALPITNDFRDFKLLLLSLSLSSNINLHLSATFLNNMLYELEEYVKTIKVIFDINSSLFQPNHYNMLWLQDASLHAAHLKSNLDIMEKDLINECTYFQLAFRELAFKATSINDFSRGSTKDFSSLDRLHDQAGNLTNNFKDFLEGIMEKRIDGRVLGTISPLMLDHMIREECYYLWKLTRTAGLITRPDCDPYGQRIKV